MGDLSRLSDIWHLTPTYNHIEGVNRATPLLCFASVCLDLFLFYFDIIKACSYPEIDLCFDCISSLFLPDLNKRKGC